MQLHQLNMHLEYRNASLEDLPRIVTIYNSIVAGRMVTADTEPIEVESRVKWFHDHEPLHRPLWMVSHEGTNIAWVSFQSFYGRPAYNATAEISIYIDEKYRGRGFGKEILRYAMDNCSRLGIKTLLGFIFAHNEPSIKLFSQLGFEQWGQFPRVAKLDETERDLIILGKRINP